jgi:periplasmic protein CpxP/Spy
MVGALLLAPLTAVAQSVAPSTAAAGSPPTPEAAADARIHALQSQLHITAAQMPQWNAFAQAMRQNAINTDAQFRQRASNAASMSALDNMKSYAQVARTYADNTQALEQAFEPLYNALDDQQKHTIDTLFREEAAKNAATQPTKP